MNEFTQLIDATLGTQGSHLVAEHAKLKQDAKGSHSDAIAGALMALEAQIRAVKQTRESLPK